LEKLSQQKLEFRILGLVLEFDEIEPICVVGEVYGFVVIVGFG